MRTGKRCLSTAVSALSLAGQGGLAFWDWVNRVYSITPDGVGTLSGQQPIEQKTSALRLNAVVAALG